MSSTPLSSLFCRKALKLLGVYRRMMCTAVGMTNTVARMKCNELFEEEKRHQASLVTRVEKIKVEYRGLEEDTTLIMNKNISTPYNCSMHLSEHLMKQSAIAMIDGKPWDMHRPLTDDCELRFSHFTDENPFHANKAFWRTGSFLLGYIMNRAFKDHIYVELHSWPAPDIRSGSFVYDMDLKLHDWVPTMEEINCLTRIGYKVQLQKNANVFERLDVDAKIAENMFEHNRYKLDQIPRIAAKSRSGNMVPLYRLGDHVDISGGPMIADPSLIGLFSLSAVHQIRTRYGLLYRVQGLALPAQLTTRNFTWKLLLERAQKVNPGRLPGEPEETDSSSPRLLDSTKEVIEAAS